MKKIENREDVSLLVNTFYKAIREDEMLGPIFNSHISEDQWPAHLSKLTDFWVTNLFAVAAYKGNPTAVHKKVDENLKYTVEQTHFGQWLHLWFTTIDSLFEGEKAQKAKNAARKMSTVQFMAIWKNRPDSNY
ncbi:hypothetical protein UJ101_00221 [Flavobacteriaceae bacterium UJ101]|nr:hypothetical protein UJ101_00221 [Flavobacteriaceae bacterium UJ101]